MGGRGQPPQPEYFVQLPVSADLTGCPGSRSVVLAQELVMKPHGEQTQDLDRVVGIKLVDRLSAHTPAGYQRILSAPCLPGERPVASAAYSCGRLAATRRRRSRGVLTHDLDAVRASIRRAGIKSWGPSGRAEAGSQVGQHAQTPGHVGRRPARIIPGERHAGQHRATSGDRIKLILGAGAPSLGTATR